MALNIPSIPIQYFLIAHFVLATWASLYPWLTLCYLTTNYFVLIIGLWALRDKSSKEPSQFLICGHLFSILNDIILLGMYFAFTRDDSTKKSSLASAFKFTASMAIINLLLKNPLYSTQLLIVLFRLFTLRQPVSAIFMYKDWQDRGGDVQYENLSPETGALPVPSKQMPSSGPGYMPTSNAGYMPPSSANNAYQSANY